MSTGGSGGISFGGDNNGEVVMGDKHVGDVVSGDKRQGEVNVAGDFNGTLTQDFSTKSGTEFFQKLFDQLMDAAEANGVQVDEAEVGALINETNDLDQSGVTPTPEVMEATQSKWKTMLQKFGPVVAKVALAGVQVIATGNPSAIIAMVASVLESAANSSS